MVGRYLGGFTLLLGVLGVVSDTQRILWGQCYSNCLTQHSDKVSQVANDKHDGSPSLIRNCRKVRDCKTCLFACNRSPVNYTSIDKCLHDCDVSIGVEYPNYESCRQSCRFLATAAEAKVGTCPSKSSMSGFSVACVDQCRHDADCSANKKCCDNGCGFTCHRPNNYKTLPKKPEDVTFDTRKDGGIVISWDMPRVKHTTKPIVYVVRWRTHNTGKGLNYKVTDRMYLKLRGIYPSSTLHVIIAAVNIHGSRGFTTVSRHTKEFIKPSPPVNFEEGATTLHDGKVDVVLLWQPPHQTDGLKITRYVVQRSEGLPDSSPQYHRVNMHKYRISPDRHKFTLKDLRTGTRYFVQVYATVRWQNKVHKGRMASMYIVTYSPPVQAQPGGTPHPWSTILSDSSAIYNISVDQSIYHDGVLKTRIQWRTVSEEKLSKYLVYWRPVHCDKTGRSRAFQPSELSATTHDQEFHLYNLHYSCNYTVRIQPVNTFNDVLAGSVASFTTPHCGDITVQGTVRPACPKKVSNIPGRPPDIQIHWLHNKECVGSIDVAVVWEAPPSTQPITGYSIQWGQSQEVESFSRQVVYNQQPQDLLISGNTTELILPSLQYRQHYTVQISALSLSGEGDKAVKHFFTTTRGCRLPTTTQQSTHTEPTTVTAVSPPENKSKEPVIVCRYADNSTPVGSACSGSRILIGWAFILSLILSFIL